MPRFKGFGDSRYQEHDGRLQRIAAAFNQDKAGFTGATAEQAAQIPDASIALLKSQIIQESGGGGQRSRAAWAVDPGQVNVPGDWSRHKESLGLEEPTRRNEGDANTNLRAALGWLARKGFGRSGQPPKNRPSGTFDGWEIALRRYNGRSVRTTNGKPYSVNYARRIVDRANDPGTHFPITLPKPV